MQQVSLIYTIEVVERKSKEGFGFGLVKFICFTAYQLLMGYLMPEQSSITFLTTFFFSVIICLPTHLWFYHYPDHHHYHQILPIAWIPLILSRYPYLSSIALGTSFREYPVFVQIWWMYDFADRPILVCSCVGVYRWTLLVSSLLLLQQCPTCLVCLTWMVCEMVGKYPYRCWILECCFWDLFNMVRSILV